MLEFIATEIGYIEEHATISCGASNSESNEEFHYINFQRASKIGSEDDAGIYFEIDDQSNGGYDLIEKCDLFETKLVIVLTDENEFLPGETIVVIFNSFASGDLLPIDEGLRHVFKGNESKFHAHA